VSSIIFNRDTNYYSLSTIVNIPNVITYNGKDIPLGGFLGQMDTVLKYIHDSIVLQYNGIWSLVAMIILIKRHLIKKVEDEDDDE
jgi:branched-subunit amino acid transport protein AzlD